MFSNVDGIFGMFVAKPLFFINYEHCQNSAKIMGSKCTKGSSADKRDSEVYHQTDAAETTQPTRKKSNSTSGSNKAKKADAKKRKLNESLGEPGTSGINNHKQKVSRDGNSPPHGDKQRNVEHKVSADGESAGVVSVSVNRDEHVMLGRNDVERSHHANSPAHSSGATTRIHSPPHSTGHSRHDRTSSGRKGQAGSKQSRKLDFIDRLVLETLHIIRTLVEK